MTDEGKRISAHLFEIDFRNVDVSTEVAKLPEQFRYTALMYDNAQRVEAQAPPIQPKLWSSLEKYRPYMLDWINITDLAMATGVRRPAVSVAVIRMQQRPGLVERRKTPCRATNGKYVNEYRWVQKGSDNE